MKRLFSIAFLLGLTFSVPVFSQEAKRAAPVTDSATLAQPQRSSWMNRHELLTKNLESNPCDLLFIGDSITQGWEGAGRNVWAKEFAAYRPANFGIGGDQTQHVLWRIDMSKLKTPSSPKVCVIHIGTNNTGHWKAAQAPEETAKGILEIARRVHALHPTTEIILLPIFPRGKTADDRLRMHNEQINKELAKSTLPKVHLVNINEKFLAPDGTFLPDVSPDLLHFSEKGYQIWADALLPEIKKYIK